MCLVAPPKELERRSTTPRKFSKGPPPRNLSARAPPKELVRRSAMQGTYWAPERHPRNLLSAGAPPKEHWAPERNPRNILRRSATKGTSAPGRQGTASAGAPPKELWAPERHPRNIPAPERHQRNLSAGAPPKELERRSATQGTLRRSATKGTSSARAPPKELKRCSAHTLPNTQLIGTSSKLLRPLVAAQCSRHRWALSRPREHWNGTGDRPAGKPRVRKPCCTRCSKPAPQKQTDTPGLSEVRREIARVLAGLTVMSCACPNLLFLHGQARLWNLLGSPGGQLVSRLSRSGFWRIARQSVQRTRAARRKQATREAL